MSINTDEYMRRCRENIEACERIGGKPLTENEQMQIGVMVYNLMRAEEMQRAGYMEAPA